MNQQNSSVLISYFQTGKIPTQDNFSSLIDSCLNLVDAGVDVATPGMMSLNGALNISSGITTASVVATGKISADNFEGSGAGLNSIPVSALTGILSATQLPTIAASNISGTLDIAQIPSIPANQISGQLSASQLPVFSNMLFYTSTPFVQSGTQVGLNWNTDYGYDLILSYVNSGSLVTLTSKKGQISGGVGSHTMPVSQPTLVNLSAMKDGSIIAQQQLFIAVY